MIDRNQFAASMREVVARKERGETISNKEMMEHLEEFELYYPSEHSMLKGATLDSLFNDMLEYFGG